MRRILLLMKFFNFKKDSARKPQCVMRIVVQNGDFQFRLRKSGKMLSATLIQFKRRSGSVVVLAATYGAAAAALLATHFL